MPLYANKCTVSFAALSVCRSHAAAAAVFAMPHRQRACASTRTTPPRMRAHTRSSNRAGGKKERRQSVLPAIMALTGGSFSSSSARGNTHTHACTHASVLFTHRWFRSHTHQCHPCARPTRPLAAAAAASAAVRRAHWPPAPPWRRRAGAEATRPPQRRPPWRARHDRSHGRPVRRTAAPRSAGRRCPQPRSRCGRRPQRRRWRRSAHTPRHCCDGARRRRPSEHTAGERLLLRAQAAQRSPGPPQHWRALCSFGCALPPPRPSPRTPTKFNAGWPAQSFEHLQTNGASLMMMTNDGRLS